MLYGFTPASAAHKKLKEDACSEPVYRLDGAGLATGEEAVHAHGAACRVCVRGLGKAAPRPRDAALDVVLQLDGNGLRVGLCFEGGAHESHTLGGEERGQQVQEESIDFGRVQYQLEKGRKGSVVRNLARGRRDKP